MSSDSTASLSVFSRSQVSGNPDGYMFPTSRGKRFGAENFRIRVLGGPGTGAVGRANGQLQAKGLPPLPPGLTPHSLAGRSPACSTH
jgi:hypothetical protein